MTFKLYSHQIETVAHIKKNPKCCIFDTCGTGKSAAAIEGTRTNPKKKLIFAPKSILQPAWGGDFDKFFPTLKYSIATAKNRAKAFAADAEYYITNIDAAKWVVENVDLTEFDTIILDESTSVKNPQAKRSKAIYKISKSLTHRIIMTGTPSPSSILDLWHQLYCVDDGERLGASYYAFRAATCEPERVGMNVHAVKWHPKPGSTEVVADLIEDIVIRHELEDVLDMPERIERVLEFEMEPSHRRAYETLKKNSLIEIMNTPIVSAVHAASLQNKLLQMTSGTLYKDDHKSLRFSSARYDLINELVEENDHPTIIACNWNHQIEELVKNADKRGIKHATINGKTSVEDRNLAVLAVQAGTIQALYANIAALSHGVTLTGATRCIFASPTFNGEQFIQFKHRIFRAGQTKRTETILIQAKDTLEERVYRILQGKLDRQTSLTELLQ